VLATAAHAQDTADAALATVKDLGRLNGQALACGHPSTSSWTRILMQNHAPKTQRFADAFDEGTNETFLLHTRAPESCPDAKMLAARLDAVTERLRAALVQPSATHSPDEAPLPPGIVPRYLLADPRGQAVTHEDFRGRYQLVAFGYTSCPDVCPTTLLEMKEVLKALGEQRAAGLQPIFITVDPERDTGEVLREYTAAFDPRILGLRGSTELVRRAADSFKARYAKVREPGAPPERYTVDHSAGMWLLGPDGTLVLKFAYGTPARDLAERIAAAMAEVSPRKRGD
jgi:protein SCO1/2